MEEDLRRLIHEFRSSSGLICCAIDLLEGELTEPNRKEVRGVLARHLLYAQSILTNLGSGRWSASAFEGFGALRVELSRLLAFLQTKNRNALLSEHQKQMASLIQALLALRTWQEEAA